jgi:hypothetical protein
MRNSKLNVATALFATLAMIVSLGTSTALARGAGGGHGGGGHFGSEGTFVSGGARSGGFHAGGMYSGIHSGRFFSGYNACVTNPYNQSQNPTNPPYSSPFTC